MHCPNVERKITIKILRSRMEITNCLLGIIEEGWAWSSWYHTDVCCVHSFCFFFYYYYSFCLAPAIVLRAPVWFTAGKACTLADERTDDNDRQRQTGKGKRCGWGKRYIILKCCNIPLHKHIHKFPSQSVPWLVALLGLRRSKWNSCDKRGSRSMS